MSDIEQQMLEINRRASKATLISAIGTVVGVIVGGIGVTIGLLSYQNSIYLQEIATTPILSLGISYADNQEKFKIYNQGNGQALLVDLKIKTDNGEWMSMSEETKKDPKTMVYRLQEIWGFAEMIDNGYEAGGKYHMSYFAEPFVIRGNSEEVLLSRIQSQNFDRDIDDLLNAHLKDMDFSKRFKLEYCTTDKKRCFEHIR